MKHNILLYFLYINSFKTLAFKIHQCYNNICNRN
nr:MAG TPA_asm: hypothetical protein [Caudoviricetes sp.]